MSAKMTCRACGTRGLANEYHPAAFCELAKVLGDFSARVNLNAVLDHGRTLERLGLHNDATIPQISRAEERSKRKPRTRK